jgi:hypothetical protein
MKIVVTRERAKRFPYCSMVPEKARAVATATARMTATATARMTATAWAMATRQYP